MFIKQPEKPAEQSEEIIYGHEIVYFDSEL